MLIYRRASETFEKNGGRQLSHASNAQTACKVQNMHAESQALTNL